MDTRIRYFSDEGIAELPTDHEPHAIWRYTDRVDMHIAHLARELSEARDAMFYAHHMTTRQREQTREILERARIAYDAACAARDGRNER